MLFLDGAPGMPFFSPLCHEGEKPKLDFSTGTGNRGQNQCRYFRSASAWDLQCVNPTEHHVPVVGILFHCCSSPDNLIVDASPPFLPPTCLASGSEASRPRQSHDAVVQHHHMNRIPPPTQNPALYPLTLPRAKAHDHRLPPIAGSQCGAPGGTRFERMSVGYSRFPATTATDRVYGMTRRESHWAIDGEIEAGVVGAAL